MMFTNMSPDDFSLQGHVIASFRDVTAKTHCFIYSLLHRECLSFNYSRREKLCELNSAKKDAGTQFVYSEGFKYFEKHAVERINTER